VFERKLSHYPRVGSQAYLPGLYSNPMIPLTERSVVRAYRTLFMPECNITYIIGPKVQGGKKGYFAIGQILG